MRGSLALIPSKGQGFHLSRANEPYLTSVSKSAFITLVVLFAISLLFNVYLGRVLRTSSASLRFQSPLPNTAEITIGGRPNFTHVIDLEGHPVKIEPGERTLIYIFSPTCIWCKRNLPNIRALASQLKPPYRVLGMVQSTTGLKDYLSANHLPFNIVVDDDPYDLSTLDAQGTPQTILVADGKVIHNWSGAYQAAVRDSIQSTLHVSLPAISAGTK
jgi:hypothetical protein